MGYDALFWATDVWIGFLVVLFGALTEHSMIPTPQRRGILSFYFDLDSFLVFMVRQ